MARLISGSFDYDASDAGNALLSALEKRFGTFKLISITHDQYTIEVLDERSLEQMVHDLSALGLWAEVLAVSPEVQG